MKTKSKTTNSREAVLAALKAAPIGGRYWRPKEDGETMIGDVLTVEERTSRFGVRKTLKLKSEAGPVVMIGESTVLGGAWKECDGGSPSKGDTIAIVYRGNGEVSSRGGRPPKLFTLAVLDRKGDGKPLDFAPTERKDDRPDPKTKGKGKAKSKGKGSRGA